MLSRVLSIGIPAYNRPALLDVNLRALLPQAHAHGVGVTVYDDSCRQANYEVMRNYAETFPHLRIVDNPDNLGIDRNIHQAITDSQTKFRWVIGEDDIIIDGSIPVILEYLAETDVPYVYVNYSYVSDDYSVRRGEALSTVLPTQFMRASDFFPANCWAIGFIGSNIVNSKRWQEFQPTFFGTYFNHLARILAIVDPEEEVLVITLPLVLNRAERFESFTWIRDAFEVNDGYRTAVSSAVRDNPRWTRFEKAIIDGFNKNIGFWSVKNMLVMRAYGILTREKYGRYLASERSSYLYWLIASCPKEIMWLAYQAYRFLKTIRRSTRRMGEPMRNE